MVAAQGLQLLLGFGNRESYSRWRSALETRVSLSPDLAVPHAFCSGAAPSRSSAPSPASPPAPRQAVCSRKVLVKLVPLLLHIYISSQEEGGHSGPQKLDEGMGDVSWPRTWL